MSIINNGPVNDTRLVSLTNGAKRRGGKRFERASPIKTFSPFSRKKNCADLHPEFRN